MRVLVTAATKHGATAEIAGAIAAELQAAGVDADNRRPDGIQGLDGYDAVVLGSAAYMGRWLGSAKKLVERIGPELGGRPVWVFTSGPVGDPPKPQEEPPEVAKVVQATDARDHALFAGKIDRSKLGPLEKAMMSAFHVQDSDDRDWGAIRAWARGIAAELRTLPSRA